MTEVEQKDIKEMTNEIGAVGIVDTSTSQNQEGDHDSGVDESTQGQVNGDLPSPKTTPSKIPTPSLKSPTMISPMTNEAPSPIPPSPSVATNNTCVKSPSLKTPPGTGTSSSTSTGSEKKLPMNKVQVGLAASPNIKSVKSKIGSLANTHHKPGGGNIKIETKKVDVSKAQAKIGAINDTYSPGGGDKKITSQKLQWSAKSKVGSMENKSHKAGGGTKKIESKKVDFSRVSSKVGSRDNIGHQAGGGAVKVESRKLDFKGQSKIGSMDNVKHKPGGGDRKIFDDKDYIRQIGSRSSKTESVASSKASSEGRASGAQSPSADVSSPLVFEEENSK